MPGHFHSLQIFECSYVLVAVFNDLSSTCQVSLTCNRTRCRAFDEADVCTRPIPQYEALKYASYTTSSLAKCSKTVPVLVISAALFKHKHQQKDWVAAGVLVAG